jgi:PST family polysaccharide transporter
MTAGGPPGAAKMNLGRSTLIGTGWLIAQNVGTRIIGFGSQILLAKLLVPADFGNLGLALTVTSIAMVMANFGIDDVLLQRQKTLRFWATPGFIASLGLGALSFAGVVAAAPFAAALYHSPVLRALLPLMALAMPLTALSTVPMAQLRADLNFRFLATYATVEYMLLQILTIALALLGFGVYSFAIPIPLMAGLRAVVFWVVARPRLGPVRVRQLKMMGANSAAVFGTKILTAAVGQGDRFVLGLWASMPVVGAYFFAFRLAVQPIQMLAGNLTNVLFPVLSQLRNDPARQREAALNAARVLAFAVMPYSFLQAAIARPFLTFVFGEKWQAAVPLVEILSIGLAFDAVSWVVGALLQARGEFRRTLLYAACFFPAFFAMVSIGGYLWSGIGVASAVTIYYAVFAPVFSFSVFHRMGISLRDVMSIYVAPVVLAACSAGLAMLTSELLPSNDLSKTVWIGAVGGLLYLGLMWVFARAAFRQLAARLRAMLPMRLKISPAARI